MNAMLNRHSEILKELDKLESEIKELKADIEDITENIRFVKCDNREYLSDELDNAEYHHKKLFDELCDLEGKMEDEEIEFDTEVWMKHDIEYRN